MLYDFRDSKTVAELVERRHPEFKSLVDHWAFCESCYVGGRAWINDTNLFRFYKEGPDEYADRKKRTNRANHTKRVVDTLGEYLFKQRPQRASATPDVIKRFWDNCDRKSTHITDFMRVVDRMSSVFGRVYVCVDRPDQVASHRAEEKLPYVYLIKPTHMLDLGHDEDGNLLWALVAEDYRDDRTPTGSGRQLVRIRLWTREEWYLFVPKSAQEPDKFVWAGAAEGYGAHELGEVPIVAHDAGDGSLYAAPAVIQDIAYMDRTLVNYGSLLDEILYEQTYSQLILPNTAILPGTKEMGQLIAATKNRAFVFDGSNGGKPEFISPDAAQAHLIIEAMQVLMRNIYAVTGTDNDANGQSQSTGKSYASGKVRQFDHAQIENLLLGKAQGLERLEDRIMALVLNWMGQSEHVDIDKDWVRYPTSFDIRGLQSDLDIAAQLAAMAAPDVVAREHMKNLVEKLFPRKSAEEIAVIQTAIDAWTPAYKLDQQLAERDMQIREEGPAIQREALESRAEIEDKRLKTQEKTAKAQAQAAAKAKPAAKKAG